MRCNAAIAKKDFWPTAQNICLSCAVVAGPDGGTECIKLLEAAPGQAAPARYQVTTTTVAGKVTATETASNPTAQEWASY